MIRQIDPGAETTTSGPGSTLIARAEDAISQSVNVNPRKVPVRDSRTA